MWFTISRIEFPQRVPLPSWGHSCLCLSPVSSLSHSKIKKKIFLLWVRLWLSIGWRIAVNWSASIQYVLTVKNMLLVLRCHIINPSWGCEVETLKDCKREKKLGWSKIGSRNWEEWRKVGFILVSNIAPKAILLAMLYFAIAGLRLLSRHCSSGEGGGGVGGGEGCANGCPIDKTVPPIHFPLPFQTNLILALLILFDKLIG